MEDKILFTTSAVDDDYFMSADLHIRNGVHTDTLEFEMDGQRNTTRFTVYPHGVKELHSFLTTWLEANV